MRVKQTARKSTTTPNAFRRNVSLPQAASASSSFQSTPLNDNVGPTGPYHSTPTQRKPSPQQLSSNSQHTLSIVERHEQSRSINQDSARRQLDQILETKRSANSAHRHKVPLAPSSGKQLPPNLMYGVGRGKNISSVKVKPRSPYGEKALKEISRLRRNSELLIPRLPFHRLVKEITEKVAISLNPQLQSIEGYRYQAAALMALQESAEGFLVQLYEDSYLCTIHAGRVTLFPKDMHLCRRLQRQPTTSQLSP